MVLITLQKKTKKLISGNFTPVLHMYEYALEFYLLTLWLETVSYKIKTYMI